MSNSDASTSTSGNCPGDQATCPSNPPSYASQIAPIIQSRCVACHSPGGMAPSDFTSYATVSDQQSSIRGRVGDCTMPPMGSPQPTSTERTQLLEWLACGAPSN